MKRAFLHSGTLLSSFALAGCGTRYFSFRTTNPVIEDRVRAGKESISVVSTRADRRTVLIVNQDRICAEPPPDVAEAIASQTAAKVATTKVGVEGATSVQTALLQLAQRSQGLEFFRTASFVYCNMFVINRKMTREQYNWFMSQAAAEAVKLMARQIDKGSLPASGGTVQVNNPQSVSIDAKPVTVAAGEAAGTATTTPTPTPTPAPIEQPNENPKPPEAPDDKEIPPP